MRPLDPYTWTYTCPQCGADDLTVEERYTITEEITHYLPCDCGEGEDGVAAEWPETVTSYWERRAALDDEHRIDAWEDDVQQNVESEKGDLDVFCPACYAEAEHDEQAWEVDGDDDPEYETDEFAVMCAGCDREIPFAWSHPDRGGRIWPVECSDFIPGLAWPEPRYRDLFEARGWLREEAGVR